LNELRETLKHAGLGKQGHSRTPEENARALLHVNQYQQAGMSFDAAIKATAAAEVASPATLRAALKEFQTPPESDECIEQESKYTDAWWNDLSSPMHPFYHECGPILEAELLIHRIVAQVQDENIFESCTTIRDALKSELTINVSKSTVHRWLHALGYQYGKKNFINNQPQSYRNALIRKYIYQYARALKEQEAGTAIIVYMDESYIYQHHCSKSLWFSLSSSRKNDVRGDASGQRIIIMHAMTKDGMLEVEGVEPSNILAELYESCALIFNEVSVDNITPADYHNTINGDKFIGWMQQRLFPTFNKLYPGKKMYLILDNAKYHHHRGPDWFAPYNKKKGQLADFLRQRHVRSITLDDGRVIPVSKFSADANKRAGGPTLAQLKKVVQKIIEQNPEINTTVPQQLMNDHHYELIYTPPYVSQLQPIELIWAFTKSLVARQSQRSRTMNEAAVQTRQAMDQVNQQLCLKVIHHCHKWVSSFMRSDSGGSLQQYQELSALINALKANEEDVDPSDITPDLPETDANEEDDDSKAQWNHQATAASAH